MCIIHPWSVNGTLLSSRYLLSFKCTLEAFVLSCELAMLDTALVIIPWLCLVHYSKMGSTLILHGDVSIEVPSGITLKWTWSFLNTKLSEPADDCCLMMSTVFCWLWKASSRCSTRVGSTEKSRASRSRYFLCLTTGDLLCPIYSEQCARPWLSLHGLTQSSTCQVGRSAPLWQQQCFHSNPSETSHQPRSLETTLRCKLTVLTMATQHIQHPSQCSANIWQQE